MYYYLFAGLLFVVQTSCQFQIRANIWAHWKAPNISGPGSCVIRAGTGTHLRAVSGGRLVQHTWPVLTPLNIIVHKNNYLGPALLKESLFHADGGCLAGW